ncbi:hypothetical protein C8R45DRAFT_1076878 [Mycena sanguinolenta]|nr:hypothetical protein C8R45DRAFT_1076878 [Mycena sanguinolenta]
MCYVSGDELVAWFKRSATPLQDLAIGLEFDVMNSAQLHDYLRLIPTLIRFRMWRPHSDVVSVTELFTALADSPSLLKGNSVMIKFLLSRQPSVSAFGGAHPLSLLPNLHDLTIQIHTEAESHISDSSWRTLLRALSTRRVEQLYIRDLAPPDDVALPNEGGATRYRMPREPPGGYRWLTARSLLSLLECPRRPMSLPRSESWLPLDRKDCVFLERSLRDSLVATDEMGNQE